jgi:cysteine-rich repeat protein
MRSPQSFLALSSLTLLLACADGSSDDTGDGGSGGSAGTTGSTTSSSTSSGTSSTTTTSTTTTTSSTSSTGGSGGGGGGEGGSGTGGGPPSDYVLETEPNNTGAQANALPMGAPGFAAEISSSNDPDWFSVVAPLGATMSVSIGDGYGGCPADANVTVQIIDPDDLILASGIGLCPSLDGNSDPDLASLVQAGTYFVRVSANQPVASYVVDIVVSAPACGDTIVQLGEECDDGNLINGDGCEDDCTVTPVCGDGSIQLGEECDDGGTVNGDGCDSTCQFEGNICVETEANNTIAQANVGPMCTAWNGAITTIGDVDYYAVNVATAGSRISAEIVDIGGVTNTCPSLFDSQLYLFDAMGTQLAYDDDDGFNACSVFTSLGDPGASNLAPGTYYLAVHEYFDDGTSPPYRLNVSVVAPGCGDGSLQGTEQCDDGNLVDGDGCSSTCTLFTCGAGETSVVLDATGLPATLPDVASVSSTIAVPNTGTISKVAVVVDITHGWTSDVDISLLPPNGLTYDLSSDNGSSGDNYTGTVFSSDSANPVANGTAPFTGVYAPETSFSTLVGTSPAGNWQLTATDDLSGFAGTLNSYKLVLCVAP